MEELAILPVEKWMWLNLSSNESRRDGATVRGILMKNAGVAALSGFSLVVNTPCCWRRWRCCWRNENSYWSGGAVVPNFSQLCHGGDYTRIRGCFTKDRWADHHRHRHRRARETLAAADEKERRSDLSGCWQQCDISLLAAILRLYRVYLSIRLSLLSSFSLL